MAEDAEKEAQKIALVQRRWQELAKREEERQKKLAEKAKKPSLARNVIHRLNLLFQAIGEFLMRPIHAVHDALAKARKAREARKKARIEKRRPILEAKALKRVEKKRAKEAKKEAKRFAREEARKGRLPLGKRFVKAFNEKTDAIARWVATPGHAYKDMVKKRALKKIEKKRAKLEKSADSRAKKAQKRHMKLARREQGRQMRIARRRERWKGVSQKWGVVKKFWRDTKPIRQIAYLIALLVLIYIKRAYILERVGGAVGFDLQSLLR